MNIFKRIKGWFDAMFKKKAKEEFEIKQVNTTTMDELIDFCARIYSGTPDWVNAEDNIRTINFAKTICSEVARLATLAIGIQIEGGARGAWLQKVIDDTTYFQLRHWVEYGSAYGTVILKPSGDKISMYTPDDFIVVDNDNEQITGAVFIDHAVDNGKYYTRLEYHRFEGDLYRVTNKCYVGNDKDDTGNSVAIEATPWAGLMPEAAIEGLESPLFAVLRMPEANNVEVDSPLGLPVFHAACAELRDLDIAYSRNAEEIMDSARTVLVDSDVMMPGGQPAYTVNGFERRREELKLPRYVKAVFGNGQDELYHEINPTLNTAVRIQGIDNLLSQIGFKCGFSNGYFVLDQKTGMVTATQVESDDRRTIQLIKDIRDKLENCLDDLLYALNAFADLYGLAPAGTYEATYDFGDITYNREEDRQRWWQYVQNNYVPAHVYFEKFEGMTEEEARAMVEEATPKEPALFSEE